MEKDWKLHDWKSRIWNINSWTFGPRFWPNLHHIHMLSETLFLDRRKSCWNSIITLQNFNKNLKTEFPFAGQFEPFSCFQYLVGSFLNTLQSRTRLNTIRIIPTKSHGLLYFPNWHIIIHAFLTIFLDWFMLIGTFWSDWYKLIELTLPESKHTIDEI